jgi:hypothetical protein
MKTYSQSTGMKAAQLVLAICTITVVMALLSHHYKLITFIVPLDYNEGGMLSVTASIAEGKNPYTFENQPIGAVVYPILYNAIVAPLSSVFGNSLPLHRTVAGIFILFTCAILYTVTRKQGNSRLESFAASALLYAALLYYATPISSPTSLGVLLFFASITIPWLCRFSTPSLCVSIILGILAFYSKQYQIACLGFVALYLFTSVSMKKALIFGTTSLLLFLISLGAVIEASPYFIDNTIFAQLYVTGPITTFRTAFLQLYEFSIIYAALIAILFLQTARALVQRRSMFLRDSEKTPAQGLRRHINLTNINAPLLNVEINYFWFCFTCSVVVIVLVLGKNPANHLSYLFQFMTPFLLIACFKSIASSGALKPFHYLLIVAAFYSSYSILSHDFSTNKKNWEKINAMISGADKIYGSTVVLPELINRGLEVYENGHTRYFPLAEQKPTFFAHTNPDEDITHIWDDHVRRIHEMVERREFDLILLDQWMLMPEPSPNSHLTLDVQQALEEHYYLSESIILLLAKRPGGGGYNIRVWRPKPDAEAEQSRLIE